MKKTTLYAAIAALTFFGFNNAKAQTFNIPANGATSGYLGTSSGTLPISAGSSSTNGNITFSTYNGSTGITPLTIYNTGNISSSSGTNYFSSGTYSTTTGFGFGNSNTLTAPYCATFGQNNTIINSSTQSSNNSFIAGLSNTITGAYDAVAFGNDNSVSGNQSIAIGEYNNVEGGQAGALGASNGVSGSNSFALGSGNAITSSYSVALGSNNGVSGAYSGAWGSNNTASQTNSFAIGQYVKASGTNSIALGSGLSISSLTNSTNNSLAIGFGGSTPAFTVSGNANTASVTIGSITTPNQYNSSSNPTGYSLYVVGGALVEKIKVASHTDATNWSDFVFDKSYKLRSLRDVEKFISKNHHLPEIPSAEEVKKDGVDLLEMDAKLLQKIEELTLYMIDMKKEITELQKENASLKKQIK